MTDGVTDTVRSLVIGERRARDAARWETMLECFHDDSVVEVSWVRASGPEFVEASRASFEAGIRSVHVLGPVTVEVDADRATADVGALIEVQVELRGTLCALSAFARLVERLERREGEWGISELTAVYHFDKLATVIPGEPLEVSRDAAARYRPSYRMLSHWVAETQGAAAVRPELPGIDRPDLVDELYRRNAAWLHRERRSARA
jgi:hypothetical protein